MRARSRVNRATRAVAVSAACSPPPRRRSGRIHLAILNNHTEVARALVEAGADTTIRDSKHDSDALGWADFFHRTDIVQLLKRG